MGVGDALPHFITFPLLVCALGEWHPLLDWAAQRSCALLGGLSHGHSCPPHDSFSDNIYQDLGYLTPGVEQNRV